MFISIFRKKKFVEVTYFQEDTKVGEISWNFVRTISAN